MSTCRRSGRTDVAAALRGLVLAAAGMAALWPIGAVADEASGGPSLFDSVLEKLQIKAKPADPAPDFVRETRPDVSGLDYIQRAQPHKVSPVPTKTPAEIQAMKNALDVARERQLHPAPPIALARKPPAAPAPAAKPKPPG